MGTEATETATPENAITESPRPWPIEVRPNGTVIFDGIAIGGLDFTGGESMPDGVGSHASTNDGSPRLTLNLGWMRAAGMHITIEADPRVDRNRTGIVLER